MKTYTHISHPESGFTLVEMMVMLSIIGVIAAALVMFLEPFGPNVPNLFYFHAFFSGVALNSIEKIKWLDRPRSHKLINGRLSRALAFSRKNSWRRRRSPLLSLPQHAHRHRVGFLRG